MAPSCCALSMWHIFPASAAIMDVMSCSPDITKTLGVNPAHPFSIRSCLCNTLRSDRIYAPYTCAHRLHKTCSLPPRHSIRLLVEINKSIQENRTARTHCPIVRLAQQVRLLECKYLQHPPSRYPAPPIHGHKFHGGYVRRCRNPAQFFPPD